MGIFLRQSHNVKPRIWGSPANVQYSIWRNLEDIYGCDHESEVLIMPGFWGFPLLDYSKYGNHGTNHGATYKDGSLDFDGDDYVDCGTTAFIDSTQPFTVSAWVKLDAFTNAYPGIVRLKTNVAQNWELFFSSGNYGDISFGGQDTFARLRTGVIGISTGVIYHITVTYNGNGALTAGNYDLYVDSVDKSLIASSSFASDVANSAIGIEGGNEWDGIIDEVRISKAARTADQVALFHDRPWDLYRRVAKPVWSIPSGLTLTIAAIDSAGLLDSVHLTQKHNLAVQDLSGVGSLDNISLSQKHLLVLQELLSSGALDNVALIQKHILSVQELSGAGTLENIELTQKHILVLQDLSSSGILDNIVLEISTLLIVADLVSDGLLDNISLTQKHNIIVQELLSSGELDNITLSISTLLIVAEMISSGALDGVNLTQKHTIAVQELLSSGVLDDLSLTQKHLLVVQELLSAGAIDNIELLVATLLTVSDMLSTGAIDNTALTQKHVLSISEVMSAGQLDGLALIQKHLLIIDSLISSGIVDNIRFDIAAGLIYISLSEATEYNISLSEATEYNISLSEATEYNISLSEAGGGA